MNTTLDDQIREHEDNIRARKAQDLIKWKKKQTRRVLSNIAVAVVVVLFVFVIIYLAVIMPVQLCTLSGATTEQCVAATCAGTRVIIIPNSH
jgi:flagellar biosynthesis/type III secretory pathway M-ring protein FliF/YscJ